MGNSNSSMPRRHHRSVKNGLKGSRRSRRIEKRSKVVTTQHDSCNNEFKSQACETMQSSQRSERSPSPSASNSMRSMHSMPQRPTYLATGHSADEIDEIPKMPTKLIPASKSFDMVDTLNVADCTDCTFFSKFQKMQDNMVARHELRVDQNRIPKNRVLFVSTIGLYQSWRTVPSCVLKDCILLLQCKRDWVMNPIKYIADKENVITMIGADEDEDFLSLLRWKDSQNLVFWMYDSLADWAIKFEADIEAKYKQYQSLKQTQVKSDAFRNLQARLKLAHNRFDSNHRACAFWRYFSMQLSNLYDPIRERNYKPLVIDERWWTNEYNYTLKHCTQYGCIAMQVIEHLRGVNSPKYKTVMEIIYQANPTLLLVTNYNQLGNEIRGIRGLLTPMFETVTGDELLKDPVDNSEKSRRHSIATLKCEDLPNVIVDAQWHETDENINNSETWMSVDYDPFDNDSMEESEIHESDNEGETDN